MDRRVYDRQFVPHTFNLKDVNRTWKNDRGYYTTCSCGVTLFDPMQTGMTKKIVDHIDNPPANPPLADDMEEAG